MTPECHGPRPLREWGGEEFGRRDLRKDEKTKVWQDDVMLFRTLLLYVLAVHVEKTKDEEEKEEGIKRDAKTEEQKTGGEGWKKIILALEQPSAPEYLPKTVSFWWTDQWRKMKEMYDLQEIKFNQGDWKGEDGGKGCIKPTTIDRRERRDPGSRREEPRSQRKIPRQGPRLKEPEPMGAGFDERAGKGSGQEVPRKTRPAKAHVMGTTCEAWTRPVQKRLQDMPAVWG